jgi:RNA polymerase sigma-70 factor (ECF subfamily)
MSDGAQDAGVVDPMAFIAVVDREGPDVYAYLVRRAPSDAEDLLGRVWVEAYASRYSFDPARGSARSWLFGVARHVLLRHWRDRRPDPGDPMLTPMAVDPWDEVDARLDSAALAGPLRAALGDLPEVDREMLLLIAWEQFTPTEAAAVVGIPPATARTRLHRARSRMRAALEAHHPPDVEDEPVPARPAASLFPSRMSGGPR